MATADSPTDRAALARHGSGAPVIVFEHVQLAFDEKVVLRDISFTLIKGHTKIILGASGSGKSITLKIITGLLRPTRASCWSTASGWTAERARDDAGARRSRHDLPGGRAVRLADRARERRLQAVRGDRHAARRGRSARRGGARVHRPRRAHRQDAVGAVGRPAPPRGDRARDGVQAADPAVRRGDDRASIRSRRRRWTTRSSSCATSKASARSSSRTSCATRSTSRRTWRCARPDGTVDIVPATPEKSDEAEFIMLKDGLICFEGDAEELRQSTDPYLQTFLS